MSSVPDSALAWGCLLASAAFVLPSVRRASTRYILESPRVCYLTALGLGTLLLNIAYVHTYLRGGPRIIDATSYWLQAHVFATGQFAFEPPGPLHSFSGRFLVTTPSGELAVLFPPGFAAVLAIGVRLGLPLMVNPLLGAACSLLTYALGRRWWDEKVGRFAGVLSALCAASRYHSADTMSHMWCACLVLGILLSTTTLTANHTPGLRAPLLGGLCAGWLFATRPVTGLVFGSAGLLALCYFRPITFRVALQRAATYGAGSLPGVGLWFAYQWATTGSVLGSTQAVYYARSDWPNGCFRLGFGRDVGCQFEHGDFLADYQPHGYGLRESLAVTGRRLWVHLRDVANLPWLPLASLLTLRTLGRHRGAALTWALVAIHIASYALFYYDGNYPGGGARLYAELLPLQHALLAAALVSLAAGWLAVALPLLGFSLWSASQHEALAEREGGRPMYEPTVLENAGVVGGLVFANTDHGFNLGFEPDVNPSSAPMVLRLRGDALDYATWMNSGQPESYRYSFEPFQPSSTPQLLPHRPVPSATFFGANLWPPMWSEFGAATPTLGGECGPGLSLHPAGGAPQRTRVQLWVVTPGYYQIAVRSEGDVNVVDWSLTAVAPPRSPNCSLRMGAARWLDSGPLVTTLSNNEPATLGSIELVPTPH